MVNGFVCYTKINLLIRGFESLLFCMISYHLNEIKYRFLYSLVSFLLTIFVIWNQKHTIIFSITPINLIFTSITEAFYLYIYFSILLALITSIPYTYLQLYSFIIPGLYQHEFPKYYNLWIIIWFITLLYIKPLIKLLFTFFTQFQSQYLTLALTFQHFISFINQLTITLFCIFTIPIFISYFKSFFITKRKILYFTIASLLALITPPDLISLIATLIPLICIIEFTFFFL